VSPILRKKKRRHHLRRKGGKEEASFTKPEATLNFIRGKREGAYSDLLQEGGETTAMEGKGGGLRCKRYAATVSYFRRRKGRGRKALHRIKKSDLSGKGYVF